MRVNLGRGNCVSEKAMEIPIEGKMKNLGMRWVVVGMVALGMVIPCWWSLMAREVHAATNGMGRALGATSARTTISARTTSSGEASLAPTGGAAPTLATATMAPETAEDAALYETVAGLDKTLFDAVNRCDLEKLGSMVTDDLEFYHDKTGLAVGKKIFLDSIKNNVCGKVQRELVAGSLEVYPLAGYGAVEIGVHRFHHPGQENDVVGEAKFIHVWQLKDGTWNIARVISFDHGEMKK